MIPTNDPMVVIIGPTASGKSRLGLELAQRFGGEILSCDALQVYRHMDIGTAKPTISDRQIVLHHLLDLRDPGEDFSAGDYQRLARQALEDIRHRSRIPFVVGGTGFYLRALLDGFFEGPGRSEELRTRLRDVVQRRGPQFLHRALRHADPLSAQRIAPNDTARLIRACEIYLLTGKPLSWWHGQPTVKLAGYRWLLLGIAWPRQELYQRINRRVEAMMAAGFIAEVEDLLSKYPRDCHAFKAIGYRQIAEYLEAKRPLSDAIESTKQESRRYAKRQLTWFRSLKDVSWLDGNLEWRQLLDTAAQQVTTFLKDPATM
jgi:tRNA dimethylallyltransferase